MLRARSPGWRGPTPALLAATLAATIITGLPATASAATCTQGVVGEMSSFGPTGGEQCYIPPPGVTTLHVVAIGAPGGNGWNGGLGGAGATVIADISITEDSTLSVEVGGAGTNCDLHCVAPGGFNGGGASGGAISGDPGSQDGSGGGATDLRTCSISSPACVAEVSTASDPRLIVAGGGGGSGDINVGGDGGYLGFDGANGAGSPSADGGNGGTSSPGPGGLNAGGTGDAGSSGTAGGVGGAGGAGTITGGGGGGGGFAGGGGGGGGGWGGAGGGGSSYGPPGAVYGTAPSGLTASLTIIPYASSSSGASGQPGAQGPAGPSGPAGPTGKVELVECKPVTKTVTKTVRGKHKKYKVKTERCSATTVSSPVSFTIRSPVKATLTRGRVVYASGAAWSAGVRMTLLLVPLRTVRPGRYTLTLARGSGATARRSREQVTVGSG